jgi:hypothetical protein
VSGGCCAVGVVENILFVASLAVELQKAEPLKLLHFEVQEIEMQSFLSRYCTECSLYGTSVLGVLLIWPLLYQRNVDDDEDDTAIQNAVESESFHMWVYASFAVAIPLTLDVIIDVCTKRTVMKQMVARVFICLILLFTASMHTYFSFSEDFYYAAILIKDMGTLLTSAVMVHQLVIRGQDIIPAKYYYFTFYSAAIGTVLRPYESMEPALYYIGRPFFLMAVASSMIIVMRHIYLMFVGKLVQDWYDMWQQTAFEVLIIIYWVTALSIALSHRGNNEFARSGEALVKMSFCNDVFLLLESAIITNDYRQDYFQLQ